MKIEIDTQRDSERELRAALRLIQELLGHRRRDLSSDRPERSEPVQTAESAGLFSMFGSPPVQEDSDGEEDPDLKHYDEENPEIEPYND